MGQDWPYEPFHWTLFFILKHSIFWNSRFFPGPGKVIPGLFQVFKDCGDPAYLTVGITWICETQIRVIPTHRFFLCRTGYTRERIQGSHTGWTTKFQDHLLIFQGLFLLLHLSGWPPKRKKYSEHWCRARHYMCNFQ